MFFERGAAAGFEIVAINDLLDGEVLKDTVVGAMNQVGQMGGQRQVIARQTTAGQ